MAIGDSVGSRVRSALALLGGPVGAAGNLADAAAAGLRHMQDAELEYDDSPPEDPPAMRVPNVIRPPQHDREHAAQVAQFQQDLDELEFRQQPVPRFVPPGTNEDGSEQLDMPGMPASPARPRLPTPEQEAAARAATPQARQAAADAKRAEDAKQAEAARTQAQRQAANAAGRSQGARREEARTVGLNTDPEKVEADRRAALDAARKPKPASYAADTDKRRERGRVAAETAAYQRDMAAWDARRRELETQRERALDLNGDTSEVDALLDAHTAAQPQPTERMRGGLTPQEIAEPVPATVLRIPDEEQRNKLLAHFAKPYFPQGVDPAQATPAQKARATELGAQAMQASYEDMDPDERLEAMLNDAERASAPNPMTIGELGTTRGTLGSGIGDDAQNEDKSDKELYWDGRDVTHKYPVKNEPGQRGGTFVQNPDGSRSSRAPNPTQADAFDVFDEKALPSRPAAGQMTREWREQMKIVGVTVFNLDPEQFDNEGRFIAAVQDKLEEHRNKAKHYDAQPLATGGYRYVPNTATVDREKKRELVRRVDAFVANHPDVDADALYKAADDGDADELLRLQTAARRGDKVKRAQAARDYTKRQVETRLMRNPEVAPAIVADSLRLAGDDAGKVATAYRMIGQPHLAAQVTALDNQRRASERQFDLADAQVEAEKTKADAAAGKNRPEADEGYAAGVRRIVGGVLGEGGGDAMDAHTAVGTFVIHENTYRKADGRPLINEKQGAKMLAQKLVQRKVPLGHPLVHQALSVVSSEIPRGITSGEPTMRDPENDGAIDSQRTTFIKRAREEVVGDQYTDEELGRWFDTNRSR